MVQPVMAIGPFVKLRVLLPALTARCDESLATRNQLTVIMRRVDMHCYTSIPPLPLTTARHRYVFLLPHGLFSGQSKPTKHDALAERAPQSYQPSQLQHRPCHSQSLATELCSRAVSTTQKTTTQHKYRNNYSNDALWQKPVFVLEFRIDTKD